MFEYKKLNLDYQTLSELEIMYGEGSGFTIFELLNKTVTPGGSDHLKKTFRNPFSDADRIIKRQESIKYIINNLEKWDLKPFKDIMDQVERYYYSKSDPVTSQNRVVMYIEGLIYTIKYRSFRKTIHEGVRLTIHFILLLSHFLKQITSENLPSQLDELKNEINRILTIEPFAKILRKNQKDEWGLVQLIYYDKFFREKYKTEVIKLVSLFYELDVLVSMARSGREYGLVFPDIVKSDDPVIEIEGLYHLLLKDPVSNSTNFNRNNNFLFLTGPNMSGKTTFLKSCGIAVFLAHLGMGVPAASMKLTPFQSVFSSLNTTDNLSLGYSYFFSEVLRIKKAAESLQQNEKSFMIFDELFKGTNVKDAYDGSVLVIEGLMKWKSSIFILSSHLLELEQAIRKYSGTVFQHFDSDVVEGKPIFKFGLHEGISTERLGLLILKNEKIEELLNPGTREN